MAIINQKYIVNNQMLIFNKPTQQQVVESWDIRFKKTLTKRCQSFINAHQPQQELIIKPNLWWNLQSISKYQQKQTSQAIVNKCHGAYSQYIPINSNLCQANELTQHFLYLKHLQAKNNAEYQVCIFKISQLIQGNKEYQKWLKVCEQFLIDLTIQEMFHYYHFLLAKGPKSLREIRLKKNQKCKQPVFFHKVMEIRKLFAKENKINSHLTVSIDRGDKISLQNLSKTMKNLFCPICMIYDCQKHYLPVSAIQNNFEYIRQFDIRNKLQNKKISALKLLHHLLIIYKQQETEEKGYCSQNCYKLINLDKWNVIKNKNRMRNYSPLFKEIVRMGVQLYYFNPCQIKTLLIDSFKNQIGQNFQGNCSVIFSYFIQEYNLLQKMNIKFYQSQVNQLLNEAQMLTYVTIASTNKKGKKVKAKKTISNDQQYNSVCFHYFLNKQPQDITCTSCDCQIRGYCLPSCGCSEQCEIKLIGCRCKGESSCWENKCWCFKNNVVCIPEICGNCFKQDEQEGKINWCRNNEKSINTRKRTMIGQSTIIGAGLGLFAGEYILKGEFVIKYLGQIIQSISLQKLRENLVENNLFYTFKLNKYESIDSRLYGNKARFINHSKKRANITPKTININEQCLIVFHALRDIQQGEQLLFNYNGEGELSEFKEKFPFID